MQGLSVMALQRYHAALFGESGALERGHLVGKIRLHWCGDAPKPLGFSSPKSNIFPRPISGGQVTSPTITYVKSFLSAVQVYVNI